MILKNSRNSDANFDSTTAKKMILRVKIYDFFSFLPFVSSHTVLLTAPFNNMQTLKFKIQLRYAFHCRQALHETSKKTKTYDVIGEL